MNTTVRHGAGAGMSRRRALAALAALAGTATLAPRAVAQTAAAPPEVSTELPRARLLGQGRLVYLWMPVYRARLWVGDGFDAAQFERHPLALELIYARSLSGRLIAERSLDEMKRSGPFDATQGARWLSTLTDLFPDVREGDRLTGVQRPGQSVAFFANGRATGELRDADFARRFFSIWLAPVSSQPQLRQQLLGTTPAGL